MAPSLAARAAARAAEREMQVRSALLAGNSRDALWIALNGVASEAKKLRARRPADGALTDAELTGLLLHFAAELPGHRPWKRPVTPGPADLIAALDDSLRRQAEGG